jgi:hypothetical protein
MILALEITLNIIGMQRIYESPWQQNQEECKMVRKLLPVLLETWNKNKHDIHSQMGSISDYQCNK